MAQHRVRARGGGGSLSGHELERLTAPALRGLIEGGVTTVIVPFGSVEHQGGHLPLGADSLLADLVGREVAARLGAVFAPTVRVGCAEQHLDAFGTLSVADATLTGAAVEIAASLAKQGFELIALTSIHGGNLGALRTAVERFNQTPTRARACAPRGDVGPNPGRHSGAWLTSVMLAFHPELVDLGAASADLRDELEAADAQRGTANFDRFVSAIVEQIECLL